MEQAFNYTVPAIQNKFIVMSRCLSAPDATYIPTYIMSLLQEQAAKIKNAFSGKDPARELFSIIHSYFETQCNIIVY